MTIVRALSMSLDERRERHQALFQAVSDNNIKWWAEQFLRVLKQDDDVLKQDDDVPTRHKRTTDARSLGPTLASS
jgi:trehalose-6-phosphate synthase